MPTTRVNRSSGDSLDPGLAPIVTQNIVDGLIRVAPELRGAFEKNRQAFLGRLEEAMVRWTRTLEPFRGVRVILVQPWNDLKLAQRVGGVKGADTYIGTIDYNVNVLVQALR